MSPISHSIADLKRHLSIDEAEIDDRKLFFGLDTAVAGLLQGLNTAIDPERAVLSDHFYDYLLRQPELRGLLADPATLVRLKLSLGHYFRSLTAGSYDGDYIDERLRVGLVHHHIGLEPKWYIGAYRLYLAEALPLLWQAEGADPARFIAALDALLKLVFFDMSLALDSYHGANLHELSDMHQALQAAHDDIEGIALTHSATLNALPASIALLDHAGTIVSVNAGWHSFTEKNGFHGHAYGVGSNYLQLCAGIDAGSPAASDAQRIADGIRAVLAGKSEYFSHDYACHSPLERRWFRAIVTPVDLKGRRGAVTLHVNITDRKERELAMWHNANYDALTKLPNRALLADRLATAVAQARRGGGQVAVLFVDCDRFKMVNDILGHAAGDQVLQTIAERMRTALREQDMLGRISGDEFMVILPDIREADEALLVANKLLHAAAQPIDYKDQETFITCSIGIALFPWDAETEDQLVRRADAAMYRAKQGGRNRAQFHAGEALEASIERLQFEADLRRALGRDEFFLHYQPKSDIASGTIVGAEALLRWQHASRGLTSPAEFIPLLEETGLISDIGQWVIRRVCTDIVAWRAAGFFPGRIAVNISPLQLRQPGLIDAVAAILAETGCPGSALEFEITESYLLHNPETAIQRLNDLHELGIEIAVDDFGTGYSNLSYLRQLPIHTLKIDQSFVRDVVDDTDAATLTATIILMAKQLRLRTVAEGVETEAQRAFLANHACDFMQGYLISRPLPAAAFRDFLTIRADDARSTPTAAE